jgi:hypothetical protein
MGNASNTEIYFPIYSFAELLATSRTEYLVVISAHDHILSIFARSLTDKGRADVWP